MLLICIRIKYLRTNYSKQKNIIIRFIFYLFVMLNLFINPYILYKRTGLFHTHFVMLLNFFPIFFHKIVPNTFLSVTKLPDL